MANTLRGEVSFEGPEGQPYKLAYPINALIVLEDALDMTVAEIGACMQRGMRLGMLRTVFWAGLQGSQPNITESIAGDLMQEVGANEVGVLIAEAFTAAFPTAKGEGDAKAPGSPRRRRRAGTGEASTSSGGG